MVTCVHDVFGHEMSGKRGKSKSVKPITRKKEREKKELKHEYLRLCREGKKEPSFTSLLPISSEHFSSFHSSHLPILHHSSCPKTPPPLFSCMVLLCACKKRCLPPPPSSDEAFLSFPNSGHCLDDWREGGWSYPKPLIVDLHTYVEIRKKWVFGICFWACAIHFCTVEEEDHVMMLFLGGFLPILSRVREEEGFFELLGWV